MLETNQFNLEDDNKASNEDGNLDNQESAETNELKARLLSGLTAIMKNHMENKSGTNKLTEAILYDPNEYGTKFEEYVKGSFSFTEEFLNKIANDELSIEEIPKILEALNMIVADIFEEGTVPPENLKETHKNVIELLKKLNISGTTEAAQTRSDKYRKIAARAFMND